MAVRRRELLAGVTVALAGCADARELVDDNTPLRHSLAGETTVGIRDDSDSGHDLETLTDEAVAFWNENASRYAGFEVAFRRVAADADPDVIVEFLDTRSELDGCQDHSSEQVLGCAPLIYENTRIDRPVIAEVVATGRPYGDVLTTTQHELGHMLGLGHADEPSYIMSNRIRDRLPEYEHRIETLEAFQTAWASRNDGTRTYNEAISLWNDEAYEAAIDPFGRAAEHYRAIHDHVEAAAEATSAFEEMKRPDTVDRDRLAAAFETTHSIAELLVSGAEDMQTAAAALTEGDRSTARKRQQSANETLKEVQSIDSPTPADVARALGLIREGGIGGTPEEPDET